MYRDIYEHINYDSVAIYQIKIKGRLNRRIGDFFTYATITLETSDLNHPVTMITLLIRDQNHLWELITNLHENGYPLIALLCVAVNPETKPAPV